MSVLSHRFSLENLLGSDFLLIFAADMDKKRLDTAYFISFCIEQYKEAKHLSGTEAMQIFSKYGVLEYLEDNYEPLHTQGRQWLMEEIDVFIKRKKGEIA